MKKSSIAVIERADQLVISKDVAVLNPEYARIIATKHSPDGEPDIKLPKIKHPDFQHSHRPLDRWMMKWCFYMLTIGFIMGIIFNLTILK
jgi:hypothetical protein